MIQILIVQCSFDITPSTHDSRDLNLVTRYDVRNRDPAAKGDCTQPGSKVIPGTASVGKLLQPEAVIDDRLTISASDRNAGFLLDPCLDYAKLSESARAQDNPVALHILARRSARSSSRRALTSSMGMPPVGFAFHSS